MTTLAGGHELVKLSCASKGASARASSIWKRDSRQFGPQNALDGDSESAWKSAPSEESDPLAFYEIHFNRPVAVHELRMQFQGGFVGGDCAVYWKRPLTSNSSGEQGDTSEEWEESEELFVDPVDSNDTQSFPADVDGNRGKETCIALRIEFGKSSDFYGRIVIYSLEAWGLEVQGNTAT
ncbi:hypothetical protein ACHAWF_012809 [Thalassiosira exigua]